MVDHLAERRLSNGEARSAHSQLLTRPISDGNHEHLLLPHTPSTRQRLAHRSANSSADNVRNRNEIDEEPLDEDETHRRHAVQRTTHQPAVPARNHRLHQDGQPLRLIFMRHGERVNQALGPDWFIKAFHTHTYQAYDANLPMVLPKRRFERAYEFDAPLTVRGLKSARSTGKTMAKNNLLVDHCLSSTALRCVQTSERILKGMGRRETIPIRIEPGLFECPHLNRKLVESFMTTKELIDNGYNIKSDYQPIVETIDTPESLTEYFERSATVMRGIIDRYGTQGGTMLIVTHAPGLLALTEALRGLRPNPDTFYRTVSAFPPLATYLAEYDGTKWKHSERPFSISPSES